MSFQNVTVPRDDIERAFFVAFSAIPARNTDEYQAAEQAVLDLTKTPEGWAVAMEKVASLMAENVKLPAGPLFGLLTCLISAAKHHDELGEAMQNQLRELAWNLIASYVYPAGYTEAHALNGAATILAEIARHEYVPGQWGSFFVDLINLCESSGQVDPFLRVLRVLEDDLIQARSSLKAQQDDEHHELATKFKDCMRNSGDAARVASTIATIVANLGPESPLTERALKTIAPYVEWMDIEYFVSEAYFPMLYELLQQSRTRVGAARLLDAIVSKSLHHASDVIDHLNRIQIIEALSQYPLLAESYAVDGGLHGKSASNPSLTQVESASVCGAGDDPCEDSEFHLAVPQLVRNVSYILLVAITDLYRSYNMPQHHRVHGTRHLDVVTSGPQPGAPGGPPTAIEFLAQQGDANALAVAQKAEEGLEVCINLVLTLLRHSNFEMGRVVVGMLKEFVSEALLYGIFPYEARMQMIRNSIAVLVDALAYPDWFSGSGSSKTNRCDRYEQYHREVKDAIAHLGQADRESVRSYFLDIIGQVLQQLGEVVAPAADAVPADEASIDSEIQSSMECVYPAVLYTGSEDDQQDAIDPFSATAFQCRTQRYAALAPLVAQIPFQPIAVAVEFTLILLDSTQSAQTVLSDPQCFTAIQSLIRSPLTFHPSPTVLGTYVNFLTRYISLFHSHPELLPFAIGFALDSRGIGSVSGTIRARAAYLFKHLITTQGPHAPDLRGLSSILQTVFIRIQHLLNLALGREPQMPEGLVGKDGLLSLTEALPHLFVRTLTESDTTTASLIADFGEIILSSAEAAANQAASWLEQYPTSNVAEILLYRIEGLTTFVRGISRAIGGAPGTGCAEEVAAEVEKVVVRGSHAVLNIMLIAGTIPEVRPKLLNFWRIVLPYRELLGEYLPSVLEAIVAQTTVATTDDLIQYASWFMGQMQAGFDSTYAHLIGPMIDKLMEKFAAISNELAEHDQLRGQMVGTAGNVTPQLREAISTSASAARDVLTQRSAIHTAYQAFMRELLKEHVMALIFNNPSTLASLINLLEYLISVAFTILSPERTKTVMQDLGTAAELYGKYLGAGGSPDPRLHEILVQAASRAVQLPFTHYDFPFAQGVFRNAQKGSVFTAPQRQVVADTVTFLTKLVQLDSDSIGVPVIQALMELGWGEQDANEFVNTLRTLQIRGKEEARVIEEYVSVMNALLGERIAALQ